MPPEPYFPSSPTRRVSRIQLSDDSDEDDLISPAQKRRKISNTLSSASTPQSLPRRRSTRFRPGSSPPPQAQTLSSSEEELTVLRSSPPRRSSRLQRKSSPQTTRSSRSKSSHEEVPDEDTHSANRLGAYSDLGSPETSDDDDAVLVTRPARRKKSKFDMEDPFVVNNDEVQYVTDGEERNKWTLKKKQSRGDEFVVDDDEVEYISSDDEDEAMIVQPPSKSRTLSSERRSSRTPRRRTQEVQEELDEDLQDLQDSEQEVTPSRKRTRGGPVTTQRDKTREHLELLKRRRAGEKAPRVADSDEETEQAGADIDLIGRPHYDISDENSSSSGTDQDVENEESDRVANEDDFVEDDTADSGGRLDRPHPDIPLQFTSFASKKPKDLFIYIIEWLVKNKIAPAFGRDDPVYNLSFDRVDDQVKAQAGSRLISSAWGTNFKNAILARPTMKVKMLLGEDEEHIRTCDACNRTKNPARYEFIFSGDPYYKKTLEPIENSDVDEDDEDGDDDNSITHDELNHVILSQDTRFYLGRFCAANAEMGHKLTHWKYHLNESLMAYLESQGVLSAGSIVTRENMNKRKREKEAENIVEAMDETGVIEDFWRNFENDLNDARLGMEDYDKRGGRSKGRVGAIRAKSGGLVREWDRDKFRVAAARETDSEGE